jgi:predicted ATPase
MHTFKNFKNFADVEIDLSKPMTLLIGRNGSGKSNLIEGVALLAELIKGRLIEEISDIGRKSKFEIRGGLKGCIKKENKAFQIGFKCKINITDKWQNIEYSVNVSSEPYIVLKRKVINIDNNNIIFANETNELQKDYLNLVGMGLGALAGGVVGAYAGWGLAALAHKKTANPEHDILYEYFETHVFDFHAYLMRNYEDKTQMRLAKNGSNLSSVLYYLSKKYPDVLQRILQRIKQLPEEPIVDFDFTKTPDEVLCGFQYDNALKMSAKLLSDGTLRALAILTALETVPEGSRVIIEEIDNGVHASRTKVLIDAIWEASNRRNLKTLITTHNSATLDGLEDEKLECVVVCHYDKASQSAKLTPFMDLPHVDILLQKGKLGRLVTRNVIEHYLDPEFEQKRQAKMKSWLESIE